MTQHSYTMAILLKDDYFVQGAGLPGRFKAEKVEFHWGQSNGSDGSEHSINGRRFPVEICGVWDRLPKSVTLRALGVQSLENAD
ncbi:Receptor-type tyrosine-protein phosphatase gamma [Clarias magur]|uniref:Receptor-type tyrosine-protein phosphatase gamma n=1 Tax=Clarias magur TaxID=1594786 RepID=A0A8J4X7I9_CLAMG|nr:Receptor-type tyrosine-protein phosphatase gamma [Clarias magur]